MTTAEQERVRSGRLEWPSYRMSKRPVRRPDGAVRGGACRRNAVPGQGQGLGCAAEGTAEGPEAAEHDPAVSQRVDLGAGDVPPCHRHLGGPIAEAVRQGEQFHVEQVAGLAGKLEQAPRGFTAEELEAALGIADRQRQEAPDELGKGFPEKGTIPGPPQGRPGVREEAGADDDVRSPLDGPTQVGLFLDGVAPSASANRRRSPRAASMPVRTAAPLPWLSRWWSKVNRGQPGVRRASDSARASWPPSSTTRTS
jgi:hypothetical protein